ncbi:MAG TPA: DivIVA domain-containing protein [Methylomirabilota bacterium]|jgi:cell division initiation protein
MRLTPLDIRQQQFTVRLFRGLDAHEVDAFLDEVANDYEILLRDNALLREQVASLEERGRGIADREKALQETLFTTQKLAEEIKDNARREAQIIVREAEQRSEKFVDEARGEEARIRTDLHALKRARRQLVEDLRMTLGHYQRLLDGERTDEPGDESRHG